jgi:hypothetical protein
LLFTAAWSDPILSTADEMACSSGPSLWFFFVYRCDLRYNKKTVTRSAQTKRLEVGFGR